MHISILEGGGLQCDGKCRNIMEKLFWVDVLVYVQLSAIFRLFLRLESDIVVTQFPQYDSQKGLDKPV